MEFKLNTYGILLLIGGILVPIALFLDWVSVGGGFSGWDIFSEGKNMSGYFFIPLIMLVLATLAIGAAFNEFTGWRSNIENAIKAVALTVGVLIIVLPILLVVDMSSGGLVVKDLAVGIYIEMAAGAIIAVSALLALLKVFPEMK
jgi:hypothetical protein